MYPSNIKTLAYSHPVNLPGIINNVIRWTRGGVRRYNGPHPTSTSHPSDIVHVIITIWDFPPLSSFSASIYYCQYRIGEVQK